MPEQLDASFVTEARTVAESLKELVGWRSKKGHLPHVAGEGVKSGVSKGLRFGAYSG